LTDILDTSQLQRRLKRKDACRWLAERLGQGVGMSTIRRWPIGYIVLGRDASYALDDLERFARRRLESAPHRLSLPPKSQP
jgi:hypothetical protein